MNVLMIILLIASILLAMIGTSKKNEKIMIIIGCLSYALSLLAVVGDILIRLSKGDSAGVMDIYPTMFIVYLVVLFIIGIMWFAGIRKNS